MIILIIGLIAGGFIGFVYKEEINNLIESVKNILNK
jgi:ABC-type lipoprotein release transport system permease subunit